MAIIIILICFISIFLNTGILANQKENLTEILLKSVLFFSSLVVFVTEIASLFKVLNFQFTVIIWIGISFINIIYLILKKEKLFYFIKTIKEYTYTIFFRFNKFEKFLFFSVLTIFAFVFIQGIIYPPNNWDSMTYHMARIQNWISHHSVEHYPTSIFRQIYQPPFSEFVIMQFNILNYGDYFSNSMQFLFFVFSSFAIVSIVGLFGIKSKYKLIAVILFATVPEVILQASSTQNDIVVSFFILSSVYFAVKSYANVELNNFIFLALSIGLATLTKGTAYLFLAPIILIFAGAILIRLVKFKKHSIIGFSIIALFIYLAINSGHFIRNYNLSKNILGVDEVETKMYSNEKMSSKLLFSNIIKNVGLHIGPYPINKFANKIIYKTHDLIGVNINNHETNFSNKLYSGSPSIPTHEDTAPNPLHLLLILFSIILLTINILKDKKRHVKILLYLSIIILQVILFCAYLKYQPWHTRLQMPVFVLSIPLIVYALSLSCKYVKLFNKLILVIIFYAFCIVLFNNSRPIITLTHCFSFGQITQPISIFDSRYKKYFANRSEIYDEYNSVVKKIDKMNYINVGLFLGGDDWEYPLFCKFYDKVVNPIHLNVNNITKKANFCNEKKIDCIISTTLSDSIIEYRGKRFYNLYTKNKNIWLYKQF